jgi:phenazine biosynthesis protein phzE
MAGHALVVDAEDTFTAMMAQQLRALGLHVRVRRFDQRYRIDDHDLIVVGPGPGDPRDEQDPKMAALRDLTDELLGSGRVFLSVCLGHQVLSSALGLPLIRHKRPNQGLQRDIDLFGSRARVGFYNTFAAMSGTDEFECPGRAYRVQVSRDPSTGEVYALRGPHFRSIQFHPESVLSPDGITILRDLMVALLDPGARHSQVPLAAGRDSNH